MVKVEIVSGMNDQHRNHVTLQRIPNIGEEVYSYRKPYPVKRVVLLDMDSEDTIAAEIYL